MLQKKRRDPHAFMNSFDEYLISVRVYKLILDQAFLVSLFLVDAILLALFP